MSEATEERVTLASIAGGAAAEMFDVEFEKALANVMDPNTAAKAKRKIVIEVTIAPTDEREVGTVTVHAQSKLAPSKPAQVLGYIGKIEGKYAMVEQNDPRQARLFDKKDDKKVRVVPIDRTKQQAE